MRGRWMVGARGTRETMTVCKAQWKQGVLDGAWVHDDASYDRGGFLFSPMIPDMTCSDHPRDGRSMHWINGAVCVQGSNGLSLTLGG